ncbi:MULTISPECIES: type II secretion system F family protein [unclassified Methylophilus]|uniref:type II secretion system F family protein n=1 Tax=unclassified Methylophilus TaxID=2630143 RepID=UPI000700591E|nr:MULTISPECIES: type II secretion system F family protein [unclassified Methylophilus]KQT42215.1 type II secretion system protein [Methylophilus sp. Leaf416]KQT56396.1 type II secretion system protein [Methylophilus sp. Leaf459]
MKFELKVMQGTQVSWLSLDAPDQQSARQQAQSQGYGILQVRQADAAGWLPKWPFNKQSFNLSLFSQELLALLESGLSLIEAIEGLAEKEQHDQSRYVLTRLSTSLYEGLPLSQALALQPEVFSALYVALIRASERTGDMAQALRRHVAYQAQVEAIRKKIISASIYPVLLIVVGGMVVLFLLGYVVPRFSTIYESGGDNLPWASRMLLRWGQLLQGHGELVFMSTIGISVLLWLIFSRPASKIWVMQRVWSIPSLGEALRIYQLARFYRTLGMLLQGGIPLLTALGMVQSLLPQELQQVLQKVISEVREGKQLSSSMETHGLTTSIANRMLRVGERTGQLDEMLGRIGIFYDEDTARRVEWLSKLLEPTLMVLIGLIVGLVVVLMYMPIFELAGAIE